MVGMTALDAPQPRRRAPWGDARFALGIVLIVASIAGVWFVVSLSRQTMPVVAAAGTIVVGQVISPGDVHVVDVALGHVGDEYLGPDALIDGAVATRTIEPGELVPRSAIGAADAARTTTVVVRSAIDVPASVTPGTLVEVWAAPPLERGEFDTPRILVADATVAAVTRDDSMIGGARAALEIVIPRSDVAATLAAVADDAAISIVPTAGGDR